MESPARALGAAAGQFTLAHPLEALAVLVVLVALLGLAWRYQQKLNGGAPARRS